MSKDDDYQKLKEKVLKFFENAILILEICGVILIFMFIWSEDQYFIAQLFLTNLVIAIIFNFLRKILKEIT